MKILVIGNPQRYEKFSPGEEIIGRYDVVYCPVGSEDEELLRAGGDADVILADEPTGNLDSRTGADVMRLFHELHEAGNTIVLITHDAKIAAQTPRAIHIHDGRVLEPADENEVVI